MESTTSSVLVDEALKRKERLQNLKRKIADKDGPAEKEEGEEISTDKKALFRSYRPYDDSLAAETPAPNKVTLPNVEDQINDHLKAAKDTTVIDEVDLITLAPRKCDWDLKRDISKKMEKLDRRTQRAIAELIRERLAADKTDLLAAVVHDAGNSPARQLDDEDEEDE